MFTHPTLQHVAGGIKVGVDLSSVDLGKAAEQLANCLLSLRTLMRDAEDNEVNAAYFSSMLEWPLLMASVLDQKLNGSQEAK